MEDDNPFICKNCLNIIINDIKNNKLTCQFCKVTVDIDTNKKIPILQDIQENYIPEQLKLYKYDDTVGDYIVHNDRKIKISDLENI